MAKEKSDVPNLKAGENRRRSEVGNLWRDVLNIPQQPPWQFDPRASELDPPKPGLERRPLIYPPPLHHASYIVFDVEPVVNDPMHSEFRKRLEEKTREESRRQKNSGQLVFNEAAKYYPPERNPENSYLPNSSSLSSATNTLVFESRFESGNLQKAVQVGFYEYDLILRPDESGHVQWYYFMVSNVKRGVNYVFNIVNFVKPKSLYNNGLRPLLYSSTDASKNRIGWQRAKSRCAYYSNGQKFQLTMNLSFPHDNDCCYLAHCYPYTYTDLQLYLQSLDSEPSNKEFLARTLLCSTLAQNRVDLLTITDQISSYCIETNIKPTILLTARVHPGETQASWSMQGCIEFLTSDSPQAVLLRQRYVIVIVPMLNPDGVIDGQYRCCSVSGQDLNRRWLAPDEQRHPCIFHLKKLAARLTLSRTGLVFYCDFHGHSTKHKAFMYGCEPPAAAPEAPKSLRPSGSEPLMKGSEGQKSTAVDSGSGYGARNPRGPSRFPMLLSQISAAFSLAACDFRVDKSKLTTGRVVMAMELGVASSYTLEVSFLGGRLAGQLVHFNQEDLLALGRHFGEALATHHLEPVGIPILEIATTGPPSSLPQSVDLSSLSVSPQNLNSSVGIQPSIDTESAAGNSIASGCECNFLLPEKAAFPGCRRQPTNGDVARHGVGDHPSSELRGMGLTTVVQERARCSISENLHKSDLVEKEDETGCNESDSSDEDEMEDDTGASAEAESDEDDEMRHKEFDSYECVDSVETERHVALAECDAPSLLLLRLSESSRNKPRRCQTDLASPICHLSGSSNRGRSLDRSAAVGGRGLLVCGAGLSRTIPRAAVDEKRQMHSSLTTFCKNGSGFQTSLHSTSPCTVAGALKGRKTAATTATAQNSSVDMRNCASPLRQAGQGRQPQHENPAQADPGGVLNVSADYRKRSVAQMQSKTGNIANEEANNNAISIDHAPTEVLGFVKPAVCSSFCASSSEGLFQNDTLCGDLSLEMQGDCLRYAAAALGECSPNRDLYRPARTTSIDISCEMPLPLPSLQFASRTVIPCQSSSPAASPAIASAAAVAALARWGVDVDTAMNRTSEIKTSPWRAGADCSGFESNNKFQVDFEKSLSLQKKAHEEAWLSSEGKGFPSISKAQSNLRRILLQGAAASGIAVANSDRGAQPEFDNFSHGRTSAPARTAGRNTQPRSALSLHRPRLFSQRHDTLYRDEHMPRSPGCQNDVGPRLLEHCPESVVSPGLEWIGGYGSKVKTSRVWKHPLLATPQILAQQSQPGGPGLPPISAVDKNSVRASSTVSGVKDAGKGRMSMATLTMY